VRPFPLAPLFSRIIFGGALQHSQTAVGGTENYALLAVVHSLFHAQHLRAHDEFFVACRWLSTPREFPAVLHMFHDLAKQLELLHGAGWVHRDLKPSNILWMLQSQRWHLIDFGIACTTGVAS
jgi:serine/threonine protein kinase